MLWLKGLNSELANTGSSSLAALHSLIEISRALYKKGDYESALKRCAEMEKNLPSLHMSKEHRKKQFEMLCLKASILVDMNLMLDSSQVLNLCEDVYEQIRQE